MKNTLLVAVSAAALMTALPALAESASGTDVKARADVSANNPDHENVGTVTKAQVENGWEKTKDAVSNAAEKTGDAVQGAYTDAKRALSRDKEAVGQPVKINSQNTAENLIGKDVRNASGETVASVEDIILDKKGEAQLLILKDGGFFGMGGKKVALNYPQAVRHDASGDVILPVTENMLDRVAEFSYDQKDAGDKIRVIPQGGISAARLMDGDILNSKGEKVADIDDISFRNGEAQYVVLSFDKVLKMGGDHAVVDFDGLQLIPENDGKANLKMSAQQSAEFETFKKSM